MSQNFDKWIPVDERLPDHGTVVLIVFGPCRIVSIAHFFHGLKSKWLDAVHGTTEYSPDFWQPLPNPPPKLDAFEEWYRKTYFERPIQGRADLRMAFDAGVASAKGQQ